MRLAGWKRLHRPSPRISIIGDTATFTPELPLSSAILPLRYDVPKPPVGPPLSVPR
jgi:hypothetical protein